MYLSVFPSVYRFSFCLSVSIYLFVFLSIYQFSICLCVCRFSIYLSIYLSFYLSIYPFIHPSILAMESPIVDELGETQSLPGGPPCYGIAALLLASRSV